MGNSFAHCRVRVHRTPLYRRRFFGSSVEFDDSDVGHQQIAFARNC
jgi:hypothetical protein